MAPQYFLIKSEPYKYSFSDLIRDGNTVWDGVRKPGGPKDGERPVVFQNNGAATFANLNWDVLGPQLAAAKDPQEGLQKVLAHRDKVVRDLQPYTGALKPLPEVKLPGEP